MNSEEYYKNDTTFDTNQDEMDWNLLGKCTTSYGISTICGIDWNK